MMVVKFKIVFYHKDFENNKILVIYIVNKDFQIKDY